jgi:phosphatidylglycerol:prolipoprotein diacylglycerol transferase
MYPFQIKFLLFGQTVEFGPYALFFGLAVLTALTGCLIFGVRRGFKAGQLMLILAVMLVTAVAGARLLNALVNWQVYAVEPGQIFELSTSGFSLYGGIFAAVAGGYAVCRRLGVDAFLLGDTFVPFLGISIAVMRIGCFLQGCCFGIETDLPWGVKFPMLSPAHLHQISEHGNFLEVSAVHPTQIYELAAALVLSVLAFRGVGKKLVPGMVMTMFLTGFSLFRLVNSFLRVNPESFSLPEYFYPGVYMLVVLAGLIVLKRVGGVFYKDLWHNPDRQSS